MMKAHTLVGVALLAVTLTACSSKRETEPPRSATEQLLFSAAADRAADKLAFALQPGTRVFIDGAFVEGTDSKYLLSAIRDRILRKGGDVTDKKEEAELVVEPRIGAISVDGDRTLFGTPAIPVPLVGLQVPEIALFKRSHQQGVIKLAATAYNPKSGMLVQSLDPVYGFSNRREWTALIFFSWGSNDLMPDAEKSHWIGD
jgi:hypothetical protein